MVACTRTMLNSDFLIFLALGSILSTLSFHNEVDKLQFLYKFSQRWKTAGTGMKYSLKMKIKIKSHSMHFT